MLRQPKRPDLLIEIAKRSPDVKYIVCGGATSHRSPPEYSQNIIDRLHGVSNIEFRNQVPSEEAERIIAEASVLLCTSDKEGFPNTFLQAWSHGTPVVTIQVDPDSLIKRLDLGRVTGTIVATVEQVRRLLSSQQERQDIAIKARSYVASHHCENSVIKSFVEATLTATSTSERQHHTGAQ
jgi:glycosyltransferase involved in cell wall biosynthesis